jgi:hypothetical protein
MMQKPAGDISVEKEEVYELLVAGDQWPQLLGVTESMA